MQIKSVTFQLVPGIFSGRLDSTRSAVFGGQDHVCLGVMTLLEAYLTAHPARHECSVTARSDMLDQRAMELRFAVEVRSPSEAVNCLHLVISCVFSILSFHDSGFLL